MLPLLLAAAASAPAIPYDLQAAVAGYDRAQIEAKKAELERWLADDYLLVNSSGHTETKAELIADYTAPGFDVETLVIEQPVQKVWDGGAVMGGIGTLSGTDHGKPFRARLRFADIWAKRDGRWQVIYTHAEKAAPTPADMLIRLVDPKSLASIISFGPPDPRTRMTLGGEIWWRVDVDLPTGRTIKRIDLTGYAPVDLQLDDGRCFRVGFEGSQPKMDQASLTPIDCGEIEQRSQTPTAPVPRSGLSFVGSTWGLDAWRDARSGKTLVVNGRDPGRPPALTTSMRVLAIGGMGSPDTPMTEVTLAGTIGRQLTLVTVALYVP